MSGSSNVDPSIPLQAGRGTTQPENPLQMVGQFAGIQNALNANRLFPGQLQQQQQATQAGAVSLAEHINQAAYGAMTPLLALPPGTITHSVLTSNLASTEHNLGIPTSGVLSDLTETAPSGDGPAFDAKVRALIAARSQPPQTAAGEVTTSTGPFVPNGQSLQPTVVAPRGAPVPGMLSPAGAAVPQYPSRSELAGQLTVPADVATAAALGVPPGTPIATTLATRLQQQGAGGLAGPAGVVGTQGPATPQTPPRLAAPVPGTAPVPAAPAAPPTAAVPPVPRPAGAVAVGLPPGAGEAWQGATQHYVNDNLASNTYQQRVFPLAQAAAALKGTNTGPGSETVNQIKSFLLAQTPASLQKYLPGVDANSISNYDEAVKYLAQYAMNQPGAGSSDMHLGLAQTANASTHISNQAAQQVVQNTLGLERMRQAATLEFNNELGSNPNASPAQYDRFLSTFASTHDPRGFSWDEQTPAQQTAALAGMKRSDKENLARGVTLARKYGLTGTPGG